MKDALGHGSDPRGGKRPLGDHPYHRKSNEELRYIAKDASEAAKATRGMSSYNPNSGKREDTEGKYLDQVNDAATVLGWRNRTGAGPDAGVKSDAAAAAALAGGGAKSAPVATHDAHEYNRDLTLRVRDGQVGSGFRAPGTSKLWAQRSGRKI